MKRELVLIRHTKSSWKDLSMGDFDRPLKQDRVKDAKHMAERLKELNLKPDLIISSPSVRTRQTAKFFCQALNYDYNNIQFDKSIYESTEQDILEAICATNPDVRTLIIIGHNPSLTYFANNYLEQKIEELPTTGVVWFEFEKQDWEITLPCPLKLKHFLTPKTI